MEGENRNVIAMEQARMKHKEKKFAKLVENAKTDPNAMVTLAQSYCYGTDGVLDYDGALSLLNNAISQYDHIGAKNLMGIMYEAGWGVEKSSEKAVALYQEGASRNDPEALTNLGVMLMAGDGCEKDAKKANEYFQRAASKNYARALYYIGVSYLEGEGVEVNQKVAAHYFSQAAEENYPRAVHAYGLCLHEGIGVKKNYQEAARAYRYASAVGIPNAMHEYALMLMKGEAGEDPEFEPRKLLADAAEKGYVPAMLTLGRMYVDPDEKMLNYDAAYSLFSAAAKEHDPEGYFELSRMLRNGWGCNVDEVRGMKLLKKAADEGVSAAMIALGNSYETGTDINQSNAEAAYWYRQSVLLGNPLGITNLSRMQGKMMDKVKGKGKRLILYLILLILLMAGRLFYDTGILYTILLMAAGGFILVAAAILLYDISQIRKYSKFE